MNENRCLTDNEIIAAALNEPAARTLSEMRIHGRGCADCKQALEEMLAFNVRLESRDATAQTNSNALNLLRSSIEEMVAYVGELQAPWGKLGVAVTDRGVTRIEFGASADRTAELVAGDGLIPEPATGELAPLERELDEYFEGQRKRFDIATDLRTKNSFLKAVLGRTAQIPAGSYSTYGGVAADIGNPRAYRAVGNALGSNPIPIIIPCHRVLASGGAIGGYGGGLSIKRFLLELEGAELSARARVGQS